MAANKVAINGKTILDLTQDTVTADKMVSGVTAHDKSGKQITGTKKYGSGFRVTGAYASARTTVDGTTYNGEQTADMGDFYIDSASKFTPQVYIPKSKFSTVFGDATIADVLAGASFTGADGTKKVGAMPNNGAASIQLSDLTAKSVTAGYYSGGTAKIADAEAAKIIPENIKKGVTILGVEGAMEEGGDYNIAATTNSDGTQSLAITDAGGGGSGTYSLPTSTYTIKLWNFPSNFFDSESLVVAYWKEDATRAFLTLTSANDVSIEAWNNGVFIITEPEPGLSPTSKISVNVSPESNPGKTLYPLLYDENALVYTITLFSNSGIYIHIKYVG